MCVKMSETPRRDDGNGNNGPDGRMASIARAMFVSGRISWMFRVNCRASL